MSIHCFHLLLTYQCANWRHLESRAFHSFPQSGHQSAQPYPERDWAQGYKDEGLWLSLSTSHSALLPRQQLVKLIIP